MKTMQELITEIGLGHVQVTDVQIISTDQGEIIRVFAQSMTHPNVLGITIDLPSEVSDRYDFQECGKSWKDGWSKLTDELNKK
jgi:hypothetical protein